MGLSRNDGVVLMIGLAGRFGERNLKQFTFVVAKKLVADVQSVWKPHLPPEANSKAVVKLLSSSAEEKGAFDYLCALEIACGSVRVIFLEYLEFLLIWG